MSNIELLPTYKMLIGLQPNEDLIFGLAFSLAGQVPLDLTGIVLTANISNGGAQIASLAGQIFGANHDRVAFSTLAANVVSLPLGKFDLTLSASDRYFNRQLFGQSEITIGRPRYARAAPMLDGARMSSMTVLPPGLVVPFLTPIQREFTVTADTTVVYPGAYLLSAQSIAVTLPTSWDSPEGLILKDVTGLNNPNQTILGNIDGATSGDPIVFRNRYQALSLIWSSTLSKWIAYA